MRSHRPFNKQSGYMLVQLGVALVIAASATGYYLQNHANSVREEILDSRANLIGETGKLVDDSVKTFTTSYFTFIQRGLPVVSSSGYVIPASRTLNPTLADLVAVANLRPQAAQPIVYAGQNISYSVKLEVDSSNGCTVPTCNIKTLVSTTAPIFDVKRTTQVDIRRAVIAANKASSANAGVSLPEAPTIFSGQNGVNVASNTSGTVGLIAIRNGYDSSGMNEFDRRDGSLPRTGDIQMQDTSGVKHSIKGAKSINAEDLVTDNVVTGSVTATSGNFGTLAANGIWSSSRIDADGDITSSTGVGTWGNLWANGNITTNGGVFTGGNITGNVIQSNSRLRTGEFLDINSPYMPVGTWCEKDGLLARSSSGGLVECSANSWKKIGGSSSGGQFVMRRYNNGSLVPPEHMACQLNPKTGGCSCPAGFYEYSYISGASYMYNMGDSSWWTHYCLPP